MYYMRISCYDKSDWQEGDFWPIRERSGSVVECLTPDQGAGGMSLTGVIALWSLSKTNLS